MRARRLIRGGREVRLAAMPVESGCFCPACTGPRRGFTFGDFLGVIVAASLIIGLVHLLG